MSQPKIHGESNIFKLTFRIIIVLRTILKHTFFHYYF